MNMILLEKHEFIDDKTVEISDSRKLNHLFSVLKPDVGDYLRVGLLNGKCGQGIVLYKSNELLHLTVSLTQEPPPPIPLVLVVAMCRPKSFRKVIHYATAMGVKEIHVIKTWRVDKSYWQSPMLKKDRINHEMFLALEQCQDTILPRLHIHKLFKPFAEDSFPLISKDRVSYLAHPYHAQVCPSDINSEAVLVVGPEGGLIQYEVDMFISLGCIPVTTGPRILRVENAVPAIIGRFY